ncbi:hypothetical protein AB4097_21245 [Microvirga sp. 2MCAF35]|uniref:hypothetical protein n=1 Tax=Microvirga sp. 2MCAF35 TaxID=3232987 RepID=UPI003F94CCD0
MTATGRWRCTDIGTRTIIAIKIDPVEIASLENGQKTIRHLSQAEAESEGWFSGPPYAVAEYVFDEDDLEACEPLS